MVVSRSDGIHLLEYGEAIRLAEPLLRQHWQEVAKNKDLMVLSPAHEIYEAMEQSGVLFILGLFVEGDLVGYSFNFVHPHLHFSNLTYCDNDALYLDPDYRNGSAGLRLMTATEREARQRGAKLMLWHAGDDVMKRLLEGRRCEFQETIYSRTL